jgi:hypothetical protein
VVDEVFITKPRNTAMRGMASTTAPWFLRVQTTWKSASGALARASIAPSTPASRVRSRPSTVALGFGCRAWVSGRPKSSSVRVRVLMVHPGIVARWFARSPRVKDLGWGR